MAPFIFTKRNGIHILDLQQTTKMIDDVHDYIVKLVSGGGKVMFVGTKKQAQDAIAEEAVKAGMPYINKRWLGGLLTNHKTIRKRAQRLKDLRHRKEEGYLDALGKKEQKALHDELNRLEKFIGGIADMEQLPQALFIIERPHRTARHLFGHRCRERSVFPAVGAGVSRAGRRRSRARSSARDTRHRRAGGEPAAGRSADPRSPRGGPRRCGGTHQGR